VTSPREPEQIAVPVDGGELSVLRWGADSAAVPLVVLVHDIAANARVWSAVAAELAGEFEVAAPDLRGRGGSGQLPAPYGIEAHAEDVAALLAALRPEQDGGPDAVLVGHAMGAFVSEMAVDGPARRRVRALVLVDGGLELPSPPGADVDAMLAAYLGSAPEGGSAVAEEALQVDGADMFANERVLEATANLPVPATLLWAPRGPEDEPPGLYDDARLTALGAGPSGIDTQAVPDTNHWSIVESPRGVAAIAAAVRAAAGS
jgi:pimeloyl-ACP methyl ester carboxylesterase